MSSQKQNIDGSRIENSQVLLQQAAGDAISFIDSDQNLVTINHAIVQLFNRSESPGVDWDWGQQLLEKKQLPDIRKRLSDLLLQNRTLMEVSLAEQFDPVNRSPLEAERRLQIQGEDRGVILDQLLIETFSRDDISGKLLILGAPGAGKTTALLGLAEQVVMGALADPKTVIPVLFELSTWRDENQSIEQWLIEQLYELHGGNRKSKLYEQWLEREVLLPLLDGLDELGLERQKKCTQKLNEFSQDYPQMVVCCRVKEFETVGIRLANLRGAVCLQPLSDPQIQDYLHHIKSDLWNTISTVPAMQTLMQPSEEGEPGLLRIPLFISLAAQVYDPQAPFQNEAELLGRYVDRRLSIDLRESERRSGLEKSKWAYKTTSQEPDCTQTKRYLSWMARQLQQRNQVELLIEQMQPSWMEAPRLLHRYGLILVLILVLIGGLMGGLLLGLIYGLPLGLMGGLLLGLIYGLIVGLIVRLIVRQSDIDLVESFRIPMSHDERREALQKFREGLNDGSNIGLRVGLSVAPSIRVLGGVLGGVFGGVLGGVLGKISVGVLGGVLGGISVGMVVGVIYKRRVGLIFGLRVGLIFGLVGGLICGLIFGLRVELIFGQIGALIGGALIGGLLFSRMSFGSSQRHSSEMGRFFGLFLGLIGGLKQDLKVRSRPNQGVWNSLQNALWMGAVLYTGITVLDTGIAAIMVRSFGGAIDFLSLLLPGFSGALLGILVGGGIACIQHLSLRFVLWQSGIAPWNLAQFLNYCTERRLLQRVGGRYRFLHRELLNHFANSRF